MRFFGRISEMPLPSFCIWGKILITMENVASRCWQHLAYSVADIHHLAFYSFWVWLNSHAEWVCWKSVRMELGERCMSDTQIVHIASADARTLLSGGFYLQNTGAHIRWLRLPRQPHHSIKPEDSYIGNCDCPGQSQHKPVITIFKLNSAFLLTYDVLDLYENLGVIAKDFQSNTLLEVY